MSYRIPPGAAADVVGAIADASGQTIVFPYAELASHSSAGVTGVHSVQEALDIALRGTGYEAVATPRFITIVPVPEQRAEETAPAPVARAATPPAAPLREPPYQRIVVTGTRITATGMDTPVPVTVITRDELDQLSPITLMDAASQLPQLVNNSTPESTIGWSGSAGQSFLNLRGLGSNRTLILIDGRRLVPSTRRGTLDIGLLPEALVDRVEIVTGGASAAYGSDAVAGVVNFILDKRYEGFGGHMQAGLSEHGDYGNIEASLSGGVRLSPNLHLLVAVDHYSNEGVKNPQDRDWHRSWGLIPNTDPAGPNFLIAPDVVSSAYSHGGLIPRGPLAGTQFLPGGAAAPFTYGDNVTSSLMIGGDGVDPGRDRRLSPAVQRNSGFFYLTRGFGPDVTLYLQGLHGHTRAVFDRDPSYMSGLWEATIYLDNPYIPDDVRQRMIDAGVDSFPLSRFASEGDLSAGDVTTQNWTTSLTAGVDATLDDWRLAAYYQFGANTQHIDFRDTIRVDRVYRAMDAVRDPATGGVVCRSTLSFPDDGCVPTSFLGDGAVSQAAKTWIQTDNRQVQDLSQHFVEISVDGEPFHLPAGGVAMALGASWRTEDFDQYNTPFTSAQDTPPAAEAGYQGLPEFYSNGYPLVERATSAASRGTSTVSELFAEMIAPLVSNRPLMRSLDAQAALRFATYDGSGDIWAWKAGLDWSMTEELRLRGTVSRDVRGGTLAERFDRAASGATARDPFLPDAPVYSFGQLQNGNPAVRPERADTFTAGVVYRPRWLEGLEVSADYYDVKIHDAIARPGPQTIINRCYEGEAEFCDFITRTPSGSISTVTSTFLNVDMARTRGFDLEAAYGTPVDIFFSGMERMEFRAIAAIYAEASATALSSGHTEYVGQAGPGAGVPDYRLMGAATYSSERMSLNLTATYVSPGLYNNAFVEGVDINDNTVEGVLYFNARAAWRFETARGPMELFANVRNLLDQDPPVAPSTGGGFYGAIHAPLDYDMIGRRFTLGVAWRF